LNRGIFVNSRPWQTNLFTKKRVRAPRGGNALASKMQAHPNKSKKSNQSNGQMKSSA
jgi:hypothetical protein